MTPATASILVDEQRVLTAVDQFGRIRPEVIWSSSDELVAGIATDEDGIVSAAGIAGGNATITATLGSETATMTLTVYTGLSLPTGTPRWLAPSHGGILASDTVIANTPGDADAIYSIEYANIDYLNKQATIRAYGVDGSENWFGALPVGDDEVVANVMPHAAGGIVAVLRTYSVEPIPAAVVRYSGDSGGNWRYESGAWQMKAVTGSDGTVFVVEDLVGQGNRSQVVVLNGTTGAVIARRLLPQFIITQEMSAPNPPLVNALGANPIGFVADSNGHARFIISHGEEYITYSGYNGWVEYNLDLYDVAPDGSVTITQLDSLTHNPFTSHNYYLRAESITPDGDGVLATYVRREGSSQDEQWKGKYFGLTNNSFDLPGPWKPTVSTHDGFGIGRGTEIADPLVARNLRTGALHWQNSAEGDAILALDGGGGVIADTAGGLRTINSLGASDPVEAVGATTGAYAFGRFHVQGANGAIAAIPWKPLDDATAFNQQGPGTNLSASPDSRDYGIFAKGHEAGTAGVIGQNHVSIRIVPRNQKDWSDHVVWGSLFRPYVGKARLDVLGELRFITLGASQGPGDIPFPCDGFTDAALLVTRVNSKTDISLKAVRPEDFARLLTLPASENEKIETLLSKAYAYQDDLDYECIPLSFSDGYNSNSWARGLLEASGMVPPLFPTVSGGYTGWTKPVPAIHFQIH